MAKRRKGRKQKTAIQKQYEKERRRLQRFMRSAEKRGYRFYYELPKIPKKITKGSVRRLKQITPDYLYGKALYGGEATYNEIVSGRAGRIAERKLAAQRAAITRRARMERQAPSGFYYKAVVSTWLRELDTFSNARFYSQMKAFMKQLIADNGIEDVAKAIAKSKESGTVLTWEVLYKWPEYSAYCSDILNYLPEAGKLYAEEMTEKYIFFQDLMQEAESMEDWTDYD